MKNCFVKLILYIPNKNNPQNTTVPKLFIASHLVNINTILKITIGININTKLFNVLFIADFVAVARPSPAFNCAFIFINSLTINFISTIHIIAIPNYCFNC